MTNPTSATHLDAVEARRNWERSADAWDQRHRLIRPDDWAKPTPCAAWDVRALVEHTIATQARYGRLLGYDMGTDEGWATVRTRFAAGLAADAELPTGTLVHVAIGETTRLYVLGIVTNDLLVHTWDLARSIGADETLPPDAVEASLTIVERAPASVVRQPAVWGDRLPVEPGADLQTRLLAAVGRSA
ncbi:MAG: TIGR03086 family metal-binding protein [Vicinamibacterales bacterium]